EAVDEDHAREARRPREPVPIRNHALGPIAVVGGEAEVSHLEEGPSVRPELPSQPAQHRDHRRHCPPDERGRARRTLVGWAVATMVPVLGWLGWQLWTDGGAGASCRT